MRAATALLLALATGTIRAQELPAGPGKETVTTRCLTCHESDLIAQQRLSRAGWGRELDKMIRWGAPVTEPEKNGLVEFLADRYPVR